jgi:hypothetical protein
MYATCRSSGTAQRLFLPRAVRFVAARRLSTTRFALAFGAPRRFHPATLLERNPHGSGHGCDGLDVLAGRGVLTNSLGASSAHACRLGLGCYGGPPGMLERRFSGFGFRATSDDPEQTQRCDSRSASGHGHDRGAIITLHWIYVVSNRVKHQGQRCVLHHRGHTRRRAKQTNATRTSRAGGIASQFRRQRGRPTGRPRRSARPTPRWRRSCPSGS